MRWLSCYLPACLGAGMFLAHAAPPCSAQEESSGPQVHIARLIRDLGSESYEKRSQAGAELAALGEATAEQLEEATQSDDPEVRLRAEWLLSRLREAAIWDASLAEYQAGGTVADVLAEIGKQTGNRILVGDPYGTFRDVEVTLDQPQAPFWEVMDLLCRNSGNRVRPHYDTRNPGLVVVSGSPTQYPTAYAGPLRAEITAARRVFIEELDYEKLASQFTHTFQLNLQVMWEDRFRLVAYRSQPTLVEALTDRGDLLSATQPSASGWNVASSGARQVSMSLRLHPPSTEARQLQHMTLGWELIAVGDVAVLEIDDLESRQPHVQENLSLTIEGVEKKQGSRYEVTLLVTRDLIVPDPQEILFQENDVELIDETGRLFRAQGQTNNVTPEGARMKITFTGESSDSVPKRLRLHYPRIRSQRDMQITFHNVPLPVGRPQ